jgi:hypothetical protein
VIAGTLPAGSRGCDTSARVSLEHARALRRAGMVFILRSIGHAPGFEQHNLSADELAMLIGEGFAVGVYQLYRRAGWSEATGRADALQALEQAHAAGQAPGTVLWCDLEGDGMTAASLVPYAQAWRDVVQDEGSFLPGAYRVRWVPETIAALRTAGYAYVWDAADGTAPVAGADMAQDHQTTIAGVVVDPDRLLGGGVLFSVADSTEAPTVPDTLSPPPPTMSAVRQTYLEIARSYVGITSAERERYEAAIMPQPPEPDVSHHGYDHASGCALWQRAFIRQTCARLGVPLPAQLAKPYRMSMAIVDLLEMAGRPGGAWVTAPKDTSARPRPGDIVYIGGEPGTYEHVLCVTGDDECVEGGVVVAGHQAVSLDRIGWNVSGVLHVGHRRVNGWIDLDALFARLAST